MKIENKKCGEIFWCGPGKFMFSCAYCTKSFYSKRNALDHIDNHFLFGKINLTNDGKESLSTSVTNHKQEIIPLDQESVEQIEDILTDPLLDDLEFHNDTIKEEPEITMTIEEISLLQTSEVAISKMEKKSFVGKRLGRQLGSSQKVVECEICNKSMQKQAINDHMKSHSNLREYVCNICQKRFNSKIILKRHIPIHSDVKTFSCQFCAAKFHTNKGLKAHIPVHTGEKPYKCNICNHACAQSSSLTKHMRTHTGEKPYKCTICDKLFSYISNLNKHTRSVHEKLKPFKCELCDKSFNGSDKLRLHVRKHTGERPYCCDVCGSTFTRSHAHRQHMILHSGVKPYKCRFCDLTFAQGAGRRVHERSVHNSEKNEHF